jgi:hypothetical protein
MSFASRPLTPEGFARQHPPVLEVRIGQDLNAFRDHPNAEGSHSNPREKRGSESRDTRAFKPDRPTQMVLP